MAVTPAAINGQLLLLYGPPGTGKTTALRALAREWLPWCETDCVLDPEALFNDPRYLMEAALGDEDDQGASRWLLLLLEDCDELIASDAKRASGQALSRLLNLTDGLLGQGRNVLVAITTNEDFVLSIRRSSGQVAAWPRSGWGRFLRPRQPPGWTTRTSLRPGSRSPTSMPGGPPDHRSPLMCRRPSRPLSVAVAHNTPNSEVPLRADR